MASHCFAKNPRCSHGALAVVVAGGTRGCGVLSLAAPAGGLLASKGGRRAVVAAAAASPAGAGDEDLPDREVVVSAFRLEMQLFKMSQRPVAFLGNPTELLVAASASAKDCTPLMECLLANKDVPLNTYKELVSAGQAFVIVEAQSTEGYLRADAVVNAIHGLKLVGKTFFDDADLPDYTVPAVPLSGEDVDKESYFRELVNLFVLYHTALYWEAKKKYGFDKRN